MPQAFYILFGAVFTAVVAIALGRMMLRTSGLPLRRSEEDPLAFVTGSAALSLIVFLLLIAGLGYKGVFLAAGILILGIAVWKGAHRRLPRKWEDPLPTFWRWLWMAGFAVFTFVYVVHAMAPESSADGVAYHLSFVAHYLREHRLVFIPTNLYAQLSEGIEMLFAFAFVFGKHSSAALVHLSFLIALTLAVLNYGRRIGFPAVGVAASLLVYASPVIGKDGISAYIDVAAAAIVFALFYLLEVWRARPEQWQPLVWIGLLAGFAYAAKYTAFLAVPYAMVYVARRRRDWCGPLLVAACSLILILPWVIKNEIWVGNPVSPMLNSVFPNPVVSVAYERDWSATMRRYNLPSLWQIPAELTVRGQYLTGFFGMVFLLAPVALAAVRYAEGRRLLVAFLVFALPYPLNIGARFLIPVAPFLALAMALAWSRWPAVLACAIVLHVVSSWPPFLSLYAHQHSWRIPDEIPFKAAFRLEDEDHYLSRVVSHYPTVRLIERLVPQGKRMLSVNGLPEAYTNRDILVAFQSSFGLTLADMLGMVNDLGTQPLRIVRLPLPAGVARKLRIEQTANVAYPAQWSINEVRLYHREKELVRNSQWRMTARPNPWEVQLAFDNSPVTRWRSKQPPAPGMYIEVDLPADSDVDHVDVYTSPDCDAARLRLLEWRHGAWWPVNAEAKIIDIPPPPFLGPAATREFKARHIDYLFLCESDWARAVIPQALRWYLTPVFKVGDCHLLRNDVRMAPGEMDGKGTEWRTTSESTAASPAPRP